MLNAQCNLKKMTHLFPPATILTSANLPDEFWYANKNPATVPKPPMTHIEGTRIGLPMA